MNDLPERVPVQGTYPCLRPTAEFKAGTISREEHVLAWVAYSKRFGTDQSAQRIAERGGFGHEELTVLLGHEPETFEEHCKDGMK